MPAGGMTAIVVNYKTFELVRTCLKTFTEAYPAVPIILIDNNSNDKSSEFCKKVGTNNPNITFVQLHGNVGHGPAMNRATKMVTSKYFFTLDTDCTILKGGFLEAMLEKFNNDNVYAVGWLRWVNESGVAADPAKLKEHSKKKFTPYIHPHAAVFDREKYVGMQPFDYHGAPCYNNMVSAKKKGYKVVDFPVKEYIKHLGAGTRRMWRGAWDVKDKAPLKEWKKKDNYPL